MTLDELLTQSAAWLEQIAKRPVFDRVEPSSTQFPEEERQRRIAVLEERIDALERRKEEAIASYDRAIALEKSELDKLAAQSPATPGLDPDWPKGEGLG